jgi:hypothetical protein
MPSFLNPYILLASLVFAIGLFGGGVSIGVKWERRDALAAVVTAQNKAIDDANTAVDLAIERTVSAAKKESAARLAARDARHRGELDAAKKSRPECARDAGSLGLLNDAIAAANGEANAGSKLPDEVRPADATGGWLGPIRSKLGIPGGGAVRPVPPPAR